MLIVALVSLLAAVPNAAALKKMSSRFAPVTLGVDLTGMPETERATLAKLVQASRLIDALFLEQVSPANAALLDQLARDKSELGRLRLDYFLANKGPWSRLDADAPFIEGVGEKPEPANFYPPGVTKPDVEAWYRSLADGERKVATGFFTAIRRDPGGKLFAVPYSVAYQGQLAAIAQLLREAAGMTRQPSLEAYLKARASAFASNDYYASDVAWMELDASIEPTIGPYEVYEDGWFNAKAAFESFIAVRDDKATAQLATLSGELQGLENTLPIDDIYKNPQLGGLAPIRVVNEVHCAGDADHGVQTAAFNLPNDERITKEKGAKRVMLKNVQQAKFTKVLVPIAGIVLAPKDRAALSFDAFFTHIVMHELMHGLGPHQIMVAGTQTTVREQLKDAYSTVEEAKADIAGLWALQQLVDKGVLGKDLERSMYVTYLASCFRSIRFGLNEAHGKGIALQLNTLLDAGAFKTSGGTFTVDMTKVKDAVRELTATLMTLQATGDRATVLALLAKQAVIRPAVQEVLDRMNAVPVDIAPQFTTADKLVAEAK